MTRGTLLRTAQAILLILLLLPSPAALAQEGRSAAASGDHGGWLAAVWTFLTDLIPISETVDNRCGIDPNGGSSCAAGAQLDNRCTIDPNGGSSCEPGF